ncbi:serine-rich adhesin for platelets-like [Eriocheir sinensis]|uniref:serine-rich adhesin for platelets-like n=1 Tax=Eriocheir sinensis TaxID=95602 RepID=UPI0021C58057|nr:serine-rich adhesin for platelets-like [Eriocheir sinensis]
MKTSSFPMAAWACVASVLACVCLAPASADLDAYRVNWCHCDLDPCLESVLQALLSNSTAMPSCSPEPPTQVSKPGNETTTPSSDSAAGSGAGQVTGNTTTTNPNAVTSVAGNTSSNITPTTVASGGRQGAGNDSTTDTTTNTTVTDTSATDSTQTTTATATAESSTTDTIPTPTTTSSVTDSTTTKTPTTTNTTTTNTTATDPTTTTNATTTIAPTTATDPTTTTSAPTTTNAATTTNATTTTAATTTIEPTTPASVVGRKRRDVEESDTLIDVQKLTELCKEEEEEEEEGRHPEVQQENGDSPVKSRRKRSVNSIMDVVVAKPFRVVTKTVQDLGVMFAADYNTSTCSCAPGSSVSMSLCIKDLEYHKSFANNGTANYTYFSHLFLAEIHKFMSALKNQDGIAAFRRLNMPTFTNMSDGSTTIHTTVHLAATYPEPTYYVASSIQTPTKLMRRIAGYKTDTELCLTVKSEYPACL